MTKWRVEYELRSYHTRIIKADSKEEAEEIVCEESYRRHGEDIYDICSVKPVKEDDLNG